ncbi:MAG: cytochrome c peroxidase [Saprospiraceae bacterium]
MNKMPYWLCCLAITNFLMCGKDAQDTPAAVWDETPFVLSHDGLPPPNLPTDNQLTVQGVQLGRMLFYETKLSRDGAMSCATCHLQTDAFSDNRRFSIGIRGMEGTRQAMPIFNMAWHSNAFFWDGRASRLRDQALMPIQDPLEMDETLENVITKLSNDKTYTDQFIRAFGTPEITPQRLGLAMEQFMLTIVSNRSKYDDYKAGLVALTESEERGRLLFETEYNPFFPEFSGADCLHCHGGTNFENDQYMNNGLDTDMEMTDQGRFLVTQNSADKGTFKVPSLRNIALTPPYMHDGRFQTLEEVIDHYNTGIKTSATVDPTVLNTQATGLFLTDEDKQDLINFLLTLTDYHLLEEPAFQSPF